MVVTVTVKPAFGSESVMMIDPAVQCKGWVVLGIVAAEPESQLTRVCACVRALGGAWLVAINRLAPGRICPLKNRHFLCILRNANACRHVVVATAGTVCELGCLYGLRHVKVTNHA